MGQAALRAGSDPRGRRRRSEVVEAGPAATFRSRPGDGDPAQPVRGATATLLELALAGIAALALEFFVVPLHLAALAADAAPAAGASAQRLTGDYGAVLLLRLGLLGVAAAALAGVLATVRRASGPTGHRGIDSPPLSPAARSASSSYRRCAAASCSTFSAGASTSLRAPSGSRPWPGTGCSRPGPSRPTIRTPRRGRLDRCYQAQQDFLQDHLLAWAPTCLGQGADRVIELRRHCWDNGRDAPGREWRRRLDGRSA